jgi:hypothetical protein
MKDIVNAIQGSNGQIEDEIVISKVLRTLFPIYVIIVSSIQEMRCTPSNNLTLEGLVGRLTTFELFNFDNFKFENVEFAFKAKLTLKEPKYKKKKKVKPSASDSDRDDEELEELEALLARKFHRGKGKYKGKLPIICFNCHEVGHIETRCLDKSNNKNEEKFKVRKDDSKKGYKDKGKKACYNSEEESNDESKDRDNELFYVSIKDDYDEDEEIALISYVNKSDRWIIDSGCSHHMTGHKSKFITLEYYNGNSVRFGNDAPCLIKGKGSIRLKDKIMCENAYYVKGLNYNLLNVSQLNNSRCKVEFEFRKAKIYDTDGKLIGSGDQIRGIYFILM